MKNIISTLVVFVIIIVIIAAIALGIRFFHGIDKINNADNKIIQNVEKVFNKDNNSKNIDLTDNETKDNESFKLSDILDKNGITLDKIKDNGNIKDMIDQVQNKKQISLDNDTLKSLLGNNTLKKMMKSEGMNLDEKTILEVLNKPEVLKLFSTGKMKIDNTTRRELLTNKYIKELLNINDNISNNN